MRRGPRAYLTNLRQEMPLGRKLWLLARNGLLRLRGQGCCGHPGEPGC